MKKLRCAIYTRKSSEEGLELQFNSLHAQRESCEAYILSQAGEGWVCLPDEYDDGGISGGHMKRSGLQRLIQDVKDGKVDVVVVYKVDRLTRSLADFSKLVEVFDEHEVSFVSVTQAFNTTNSMGRLTLNVLLSFAQFEREVTGERIRDKIALSRKRGLWTGGLPPLGYDAIEKKLIVNQTEGKQVQHIFERYAKLKNVRKLKAELDRNGYVSKHRISKKERKSGGTPFERGALYTILKNTTYIGLTKHQEETFDGEHDAIVDETLFDKVQSILGSNRRRTKVRAGAKHRSLLSGLIVTDTGNKLTPTHANNHGRRYRYYVERKSNNQTGLRPIRLPSHEVETSVCQELVSYLSDPVKLIDDLKLSETSHEFQQAIRDKGKHFASSIGIQINGTDGYDVVLKIVKWVKLWAKVDGYALTIDLQSLANILEVPNYTGVETVDITVSLKLKICNNGKKLIIGNKPTVTPFPNPTLINALKIAHEIKEQYLGVDSKPLTEIAISMDMNKRQVWRTLKLAFLAPDIQLAILSGTHPRGLCLQDLANTPLPTHWDDQRKLHGFA